MRSLASLLLLLGAASGDSTCKCFPGDACWPTLADWKGLNQSVNGRLVATVPLGSVCHGANYDATKCGAIQAAWHVPETHTDTSSSLLAPYFANQSCSPFLPKDTPCYIGTYVQYAVDVSDVSHIQKALAFAQQKNIRFVVRNTGHDYMGKSTGAGALAVWTHHLKSFQVLDYSCASYTGKAVKMGAGVQAGDAHIQAFKQGLTLIGGVCPTVGLAGGYTQGGGLGPLTGRYGFGADQVLEWQVVLANGSFVTATPTSHTDLYWALSGGGGGAYGVVTSMTVKAHKNEQTTAANLSFANSGNGDAYFEAIKAFQSTIPALSDAGATGFWTMTAKSFLLGPATAPGITKDALDKILQPAILKLKELNIPYNYTSAQFPSYYECYKSYNPPDYSPGLQIGGRLVPRPVFTGNQDGFIQAIRSIVGYGAAVVGVSYKAPPNNGPSNSINSALRDTLISFQIGILWNDTNWDVNIKNGELITNTLVPSLAKLIPGGGSAYLNQADFREPKWQQVFYGSNYQTLVGLKAKYDPAGIFWGPTVVGSERWIETKDKRLCKAS
ncbi:FAD-linked oxidoreductase sor8 [Conoideocrella luteorostrata]|uniref:FAD-linked oxidoreductase sor8 n=1 Tax=Conoideocrella luteorostrata TaxID=1105319 RepID=A0AAJ0CTT7_9HYPO|nr:FAD-linked oxidoreductase sor8 [Conoideocrella luteorostrata]